MTSAQTSLDVVELIMALEDEFNLVIPDEDAERLDTVEHTVAYQTMRLVHQPATRTKELRTVK